MTNLASIIDRHDASQIALISRGRAKTYGELREQVALFRGSLTRMGVGPGDRVALLCGNGRYFVVAYLATVGIGAIAVPMNPLSPSPELLAELSAVTPKVVLCEASAVPSFSGVDRAAIAGVSDIIVTDDKGAAMGGSATIVHFDTMLTGEPAPMVEVSADTPAVLIFTSGTAGAPRAATLSHGNLLSNLDQINSTSDHISKGDVVFGVLPLFHIFGLNVVLGTTLLAGATVVLVQRFDPVAVIETIVERKVTVLPGAPPVWVALSLLDGNEGKALSNIRLALTGAARMPDDAAQRLKEKFGITLREGYGLTEAAPVVTSSIGVENRVGSVGRAVRGVAVRVVDESGDDVLVGDPGEVLVKGPNVFLGYWNDDEATRRVIDADGWLHTGDIATVDGEGYLYLVDRSKDLIIVSGFNVYPAEVEDVLMRHSAVAEAGVIGVPHPQTGEAVRAYVVLRPGHEADEDALIDHCHDHIARYKCPSKVLIVPRLPRNDAGKLLRRSL